jgi:hypothetical protein
MTSQRRARIPDAPNVVRSRANTLEDLEKGELLESMHFVEFRSLTSIDAQISCCREKLHCFKRETIAHVPQNQNLPCVDGRALAGQRHRRLTFLNRGTTNRTIPTVSSPLGKRNAFVDGLSTASRKGVPWFSAGSSICVISPK